MPGHGAELAGFVRQILLDDPPAGVALRCVGRRLGRQQPEHLLVTCWEDEAAFARGTDRSGMPAYLSTKSDLLLDRRSSAFAVTVWHGDGPKGSRILRLYQAHVGAADVEAWKRRAVEQTAQLAEQAGLVCVRAGVSLSGADSNGEVAVMTLTAWSDWERVLTATGGHIDRYVRDDDLTEPRHSVGSDRVDHYEVLE